MSKYLLIIIYLVFISLGLPDSLLGSGWPVMQKDFNVDSSYAGYISMTISAMTIISALLSVYLTNKLTEKWVIIISIALCVLGLILFSIAKKYWNLFIFSVPYGLGAGSIDASINNFVAIHYSSRVMNFLHCFYGVGSMISPNVMALALKYKGWKEGYRWTAYIQMAILVVCFATLSLWKNDKDDSSKKIDEKKSDQSDQNKEDKKDGDNKDEEKKDEEKGEDIKKEIEQSSNKMIKVNMIKVEKKMNKKDRIDTDEELTKRDDKEEKETELDEKKVLSICDVLKIKGVAFSCIAFFAYCSGEGTCFLWTSSFFDGTKEGLSKDAVASLSTTIFGGLMLGRVLSGLVSEKLGDKKLIRIGLIIEIIGIICVGIPIKTYVLAIIGYCLTSIGMGPIYPSIQHLVPILFGKEASPTIIGLQMASAYLGTTLMPFVFGLIQSKTSMWAHPIYIGVFAILNFIFIEIEFKLCDKNNNNENEENKEDNDKKENEDNKKNEDIQINK
jgi:fucose permease